MEKIYCEGISLRILQTVCVSHVSNGMLDHIVLDSNNKVCVVRDTHFVNYSTKTGIVLWYLEQLQNYTDQKKLLRWRDEKYKKIVIDYHNNLINLIKTHHRNLLLDNLIK